MFVFTYLVVPLLLAAQGTAAPATSNDDTPCLSACGKWSAVVETCYNQFTTSPHTKGYAYSNQFLACLCTGKNNQAEDYGNTTMTQAASVCQSCSTTPNNIKGDLSNGSSTNASSYAPLGYKTGKDANPNPSSAAVMDSPAVMLGAVAVLLTGALAAF